MCLEIGSAYNSSVVVKISLLSEVSVNENMQALSDCYHFAWAFVDLSG